MATTGGDDGWSKVAGDGSRKQMSKSQIKKEKQRAREREKKRATAEEMAEGGADATKETPTAKSDIPMTANTVWEKGEMLAKQKEERRQAQVKREYDASELRTKNSEAKSDRRQELARPTKKKGATSTKKSGFDLETALAKMETAAAALSTDDLEMKMAGVVGRSVTERFDLFASVMVAAFEGCIDIPVTAGEEAVEAPWRFLTSVQKESLSSTLLSIVSDDDNELLKVMFADCVKKVVDLFRMKKSTTGMMCILQAMVRDNVTRLDLAAQSLSTVVKVFNAAFPRDDPVLPIMTAYAQVVASDPRMYLRMWSVLNMRLLLDGSSTRVKDAAVACLGLLVFPKTQTPRQWYDRLQKVPHERLPSFEHAKLYQYLDLNFSPRYTLSKAQNLELMRCWRPIADLSVQSPTCVLNFTYFLGKLDKIDPGNQQFRDIVADFLNLCLATQPKACARVMVQRFDQHPRATLEIFAHLSTKRWANKHFAAQRHPDILVRTIDELLPKVEVLLPGDSSMAMLLQVREMLTINAAGEGFSFLWLLIVVFTCLFLINVMYLGCRFGPETGIGADQVCSTMRSTGVTGKLDAGYMLLVPYALKLQPYVDVVVPHVTKARAASAPYLARVMEVLRAAYLVFHANVGVHCAPYVSKAMAAASTQWAAAKPVITQALAAASMKWVAAKPVIIGAIGHVGAVVNDAVLAVASAVIEHGTPIVKMAEGQHTALYPHFVAGLKAFLDALVAVVAMTVKFASPHVATVAAAVAPFLAAIDEAVAPLIAAISS